MASKLTKLITNLFYNKLIKPATKDYLFSNGAELDSLRDLVTWAKSFSDINANLTDAELCSSISYLMEHPKMFGFSYSKAVTSELKTTLDRITASKGYRPGEAYGRMGFRYHKIVDSFTSQLAFDDSTVLDTEENYQLESVLLSYEKYAASQGIPFEASDEYILDKLVGVTTRRLYCYRSFLERNPDAAKCLTNDYVPGQQFPWFVKLALSKFELSDLQ